MIQLAITTSTNKGSIAVGKDGKLLAERKWTRTSTDEVLTLNIQKLLKKLRLAPNSIQLVAVDKGPGSFTGSRMAVNVARTFAQALSIPLFAVHSLDIIATQACVKRKGRIYCLLNAHKALIYFGAYNSVSGKVTRLGPIEAVSIDQIVSKIEDGDFFAGDIPSDYLNAISQTNALLCKSAQINFPRASTLIKMIGHTPKLQTWPEVEPSYIRSPV